MYADVNMAFGDIVKVTPSSKVVGDLALYLVSHEMRVKDLENLPPDHQLTLPNSVADMFMGSLGQPEGGWPPKLQKVVLRGKKPQEGRPGEQLAPVDLEQAAVKVTEQTGSRSRTDLMSYLMYPDVFLKFAAARTEYGDLEVLPTPQFFYGLQEREEVTIELEPGKTLIVRLLTVRRAKAGRNADSFLRAKRPASRSGSPRQIDQGNRGCQAESRFGENRGSRRADSRCCDHLARELGEQVKKGDRLLVMEAMKMQTTVYAQLAGTVNEIHVKPRDAVEARDLLLKIE